MVTIDGTTISGATIDGQNVKEITIDGNSVWTAQFDYEGFEGGSVSSSYFTEIDDYYAKHGNVTSDSPISGSYSLYHDTGSVQENQEDVAVLDNTNVSNVTYKIKPIDIGMNGSTRVEFKDPNDDISGINIGFMKDTSGSYIEFYYRDDYDGESKSYQVNGFDNKIYTVSVDFYYSDKYVNVSIDGNEYLFDLADRNGNQMSGLGKIYCYSSFPITDETVQAKFDDFTITR